MSTINPVAGQNSDPSPGEIETRLVHAERGRRRGIDCVAQRPRRRRRRRCRRLARPRAGNLDAGLMRDALRQIVRNIDEHFIHRPGANGFILNLIKFKGKCCGNVLFLPLRHAVPEHCRLAEMIGKTRAALPHFGAVNPRLMGAKRLQTLRPVHRTTAAQTVGEIRHPPGIDGDAGMAFALIVVDGVERTVDRQLGKIRPDARDLRVRIGEQPPLQQRVIAEINAGGPRGRDGRPPARFQRSNYQCCGSASFCRWGAPEQVPRE